MQILYRGLFTGLLAILAALSSGHAQDLRATLFAEVEVAMKAARDAQAELLAPRGFARASLVRPASTRHDRAVSRAAFASAIRVMDEPGSRASTGSGRLRVQPWI